MRRFALVIFLTLVCACAVAQSTLLLPYSATSLTDEERAANPDRLAYPTDLKDAVANEVGFACNTPPVTVVRGTFSVSPTRKVTFSPGNLQYNAARGNHLCADGTTQQGTWRFAEHQWDYVGDAEVGNVYANGVKCDNSLVSADYDGWIDLFGWGTGNAPTQTSTSTNDYSSFVDWGQNAISNGGNEAGMWRTLSKDEWTYLFHGRVNYDKLFALGKVAGVNGVILLPDDWTTPAGLSFLPSAEDGLNWDGTHYSCNECDRYTDNTYTTEQWGAMEANGAVFFPAAGSSGGTEVYYPGENGRYWSSTQNGPDSAYYAGFYKLFLMTHGSNHRYYGRCVRLVKDSVVIPTYVPKPFSVSANKQVTFSPGNLQYNAARGSHLCADGTTQQGTWRFAERQWDYVGDAQNGTVYHNGTKCSNTNIGETYNGWIDLFGWGTSGWNSGANAWQPWAASVSNSDYYPGGSETDDLTGDYAYSDWARYNTIGYHPAGTWRTLAKDEWVWLFHERENAERLFGMGTVNGVQGTIILPDGWVAPVGIPFNASTDKGLEWNGTYYESSTKDIYSHNVYTDLQWGKMEAAGAVFLPAGGGRSGTTVNYASESGNYWSSSRHSAESAFRMRFYTHYLDPSYDSGENLGRSVRPVRDVEPPPPPSAYKPKPFSVSADRQVLFSPGNLQYNAARGSHLCADGTTQQGTWRFAEHQWDYVGDAENGNVYANGVKCDNSLLGETYDGWIDLFGWGTSGWNSGANAYQPWATSENNADYYPGGTAGNDLTGSYANADWGVYNAIGNDPAGTWRTLTRDEWVYLLHERENAERLFGTGTVNGVQGTIILPDDWSLPSGVSFTPSTEKGLVWEGGQYTNANNDNYSHNTYTTAQWNIMETSGAVFIPTGGRRDSNTVKNASLRGFCWSSSAGEDGVTYILRFTTDALYPQHVSNPYRGRGVRLVKDSVVTPTYVPKPFSVSANKQVTFSPGNLQYNAARGSHLCADGTTQQGTWRFAEHQWDYVGNSKQGTIYENGVKCSNTLVDAAYDGWIDLFAWGTSGWNSGANEYMPWATGKANDDYISEGYEESDLTGSLAWADWGMYNEINGDTPGTWRSLTKEESYYLLVGRANANQLFGFGTVNNIIGLILLPDEWTTPSEVTFASGSDKGMEWDSNSGLYNSSNDHFADNVYTGVQWQKMENAGAVFLPAAGYRREKTGYSVRESGNYWLASYGIHESSHGACYMNFPSNRLYPERHHYRYNGGSVRLVKDQTPPPPSAYIPQPFSISADRQILFSPGNLQYNATQGTHQCADGTTLQGTWRFAEHQWDYVGDTEIGTVYHNGTKCSNTKISSKYDGWIDLFAWGTSGWNSGAKNYRPWNEGKTNSNYLIGGKVENDMRGKYSYADWGVYNDIVNGTKTDPAGTWHTMTENDWAYIVLHRPNAAELFALATVNGVKGMILLPDNWNPADKPHIVTSTEQGFYVANDTIYNDQRGSFETNILSATQWLTMEAAGAVFLPCAGHRHEKTLKNVNEWGDYSPSTNMAKRYRKSKYELPVFFFSDISCKPGCPSNVRYCGKSIRLVSDYPPSSAMPPRSTTIVAADYWTPYTEYWSEEPEPWISTGHRTATAELWAAEPERRTPKPERKTPKEDDPEDDTYVEEPADTVCWQSSYRFHDYDYPLPSVTVCRDRDYVAYTLEYFDKDACTHYLKDIAIATTEGGTVELYDTICDGTTYDFFGDQLTKADVYTKTFPIAPGCEQVHILHLTVQPRTESHDTVSIFTGDSYQWNGEPYTESGDYPFQTTGSLRCDSTAWLHLTVRDKPVLPLQETATLCDGESMDFYGETLTPTVSQEYTRLVTGDEQDTLVTLTLDVFPRYEDIYVYDTVTNGTTYEWEEHTYSEAGEYHHTYQSIYGCDSVVTLRLTDNKVEIMSATCNDLCKEENALHIRLDYKGTAHSVRLTFDSAAQASGWRDTLIAMPKDGDIVIPVRGRAGQFTCFAELLFRDSTAASVTVHITLPYPSTVLKQLWEDGVAVMKPDYNGGYDFVAFQWYENGVPLAGETGSILYRPLIMGGEYSALLTESNGRRMMTCPLVAQTPTGMEDTQADVSLYPTIVSPCQSVHCLVSCPAEMTLYDPAGKLSLRLDLQTGENRFAAPVQPGVYIVNINVSNRPRTYKLVVR